MENIDHIIEQVAIKKSTSNKTGKEYEALIIKLDNGYEKMIFLEFPEMFMVKELLKKANSTTK